MRPTAAITQLKTQVKSAVDPSGGGDSRMSILGDKIEYEQLKAKQKEIFNFQKVSSIFADYGYTTIKLADDWLGADFLALAFHGEKAIKVQLKGRMTFSKKYVGKQIFICFHDSESRSWYLYNHDSLLKEWRAKLNIRFPGKNKETIPSQPVPKSEGTTRRFCFVRQL